MTLKRSQEGNYDNLAE